MQLRVGHGLDVHPLCEGRALILGGVTIPHARGLSGHSDADAVLHALIDGLLGAAAMGDIGCLFPDTDQRWRGISSIKLLELAWAQVREAGWGIQNVDISIVAQAPKLRPFIPEMQRNIGAVLGITPEQCGIKAGTTEKLGFLGREEGILVSSVVLLAR